MPQTHVLRSLFFAVGIAVGIVTLLIAVASVTYTAHVVPPPESLRVLGMGGDISILSTVSDGATVMLALGATLACLISWRLGRYGMARAPVLSHAAQNNLLIKALNHIDLCIIIYDREMRVVHWNTATVHTFPHLLPQLERGASLPELIALTNGADLLRNPKKPPEARQFADSIVASLRAGRDVTRMVTMSDGRVFEAVEFAFGPEHFASVRKNVTTQQKQADQIFAQNVRLSMVNERMQHFSEMAAHDLRAPLLHQSTLMNFIAEDLRETNTELPPEIHEYLDLSRGALERMQQLVEDLLEYARCDAPATPAVPVRLNDRLDSVLQLVAVPQGFSIHWEQDLPELGVPEAACDIVLRNLISNAIKHHDRDHGQIYVTARVVAHTAIIRVTDDGPGIPEAAQAKIFEPFQQLFSDTSRRGSGLGLAMVSRTVAGWNGEITVESGPGRGSVFCFSAPLATKDSGSAELISPDHLLTGTG